MSKLRVCVLFGGRSGEHEVSLVSATSVMNALDKSKYEVIPVGITKSGRWIGGSKAMQLLKRGEDSAYSSALVAPDPNEPGLVSISPVADQGISHQELSGKVDVVLPILHGHVT